MGGRAAKAALSSLPAELTSFVGRRRELREVKRLMSTSRLVTLVGSGGSGKTRLALRAAAEMARGFPGGVWFVSLAGVQDALLVPQAVFNGLGVHDLSAALSLSTLIQYLDSKRLLLVLDNCEHLLDASAVLAGSVLRGCPDIRVLATSRQALGVAGEVRIAVPPMSLPPNGEGSAVGQPWTSDAVWLFSERAADVVQGFVVDGGNADAVLRLCRHLDGIPLALELAAVRLASLSLEQLNEGLAGELSILGTGDRGAEPRQQTLEATIGWSYGLLGESERFLWARLSVFANGFDADAAVAVCADARLPADSIVGLLGALVDKSIMTRQMGGGNTARYALLETLRQYGRRRLRESGEEAALQRRHFRWVCELGRSVGAWDGRQPEHFNRVHAEHDNLWAALEFCQRHPDEIAAAAELARDLMPYWVCRGPYREVRRVLTALIELSPVDSLPRARLVLVAAVMAATQNEYGGSGALARESWRMGQLVKDVEVVAWSLIHIAVGVSSYLDLLLGAALTLVAIMVVWAAPIPRPIGLLMGLSGVAFIVLGWLVATTGFTPATALPSVIGFGGLLILAVWLYLIARRPVPASAPADLHLMHRT